MSAQWDQYILKQQCTGYTVHIVSSYPTANPNFYIYPHFLHGSGGGVWVVSYYTLCCVFLSCCHFIS